MWFSLQVLKLFEQFDAPDYVIRVAHTALDLAAPSDPNIVSINLLLTEHEGRTGEYWPEVRGSTKSDRGPIFSSTARAS